MFFKLSVLLMVLCVLLTGCSAVNPTPASTTLAISYPEQEPELSLETDLPGMIRAIGDSGTNFVTGTVEVSDSRLLPAHKTSGGKVTLAQTGKTGTPDSQNFTNLWKLRISDNEPFKMKIKNLKAEGHWNFSGLPITELTTECGTAKNAFTFDAPNPTLMTRWELKCGAGNAIAEGLLNSACTDMTIRPGVGSLTLRFNGNKILTDMKVTISSGAGEIYIIVPPEIPARIEIAGQQQVRWGDGIRKSDGSSVSYETLPYRNFLGDVIKIYITAGSSSIYLNAAASH